MSKALQIAKKLNGVVGVMNTPFTPANEIDRDSIYRYIDYYIAHGVSAFLVTAMASEVQKLTFEERILISGTAVERTAGKVPVIAGIAAATQKQRLQLTQKYMELGCDGIMVSIPYSRDKAFVEQINEISGKVDGLLMVQDWDFENIGIPLEIILDLYNRLENFECLKVEVKPAGIKYSSVIEATKGKLNVSGGWASSQMIEGLDRGVNAFMATILPDVYCEIYRLHRSGKRAQALELFNKIIPVLAFSHQHIDISLHFNKRLVHAQGLFATAAVREPVLPFDNFHIRIADELIKQALELSSFLKI
jgi:dihydrodipicolinate synthase/N-acetylneuraminate lyase